MLAATIFLQRQNFIDALYIVAFSLFIYGLMGLTGPRTAVRGNKIAAGGMAIAVVATLLTPARAERLGHRAADAARAWRSGSRSGSRRR